MLSLTEISYLGYIIGEHGISLDLEKVQAIQEWEVPTTAQQIRSFMGLCQAYSRHMKNFSELSAPLTDLLKGCKTKRQKVAVSGKALKAFHALKNLPPKRPYSRLLLGTSPLRSSPMLATLLLAQFFSKMAVE